MNTETAGKHQRVAEYLRQHNLDGVLLSRRCNYSWYTAGKRNYVNTAVDAGICWLLVTADGAKVLTSNIESPRLRLEEYTDGSAEVIDFPYYDAAERDRIFKQTVGSMKVAVDAPAPGLSLPMLDADFDLLRQTLTDGEIERYRYVCNRNVAAIEFVARDAQPGMTEFELAGMLSGAIAASGCLPWVVLVASDERVENFRHPLPTGKTVNRYFMLVACAERDGMIASCTRLASFGPLSDTLRRKHDAVIKVDTAMIAATRVGATIGGVYAECQAAYAAVGFPNEWQNHHQGGLCGYNPREIVATPGDATPILANQAFAWNPSIAGTKSEDTIICRAGSTELLCDPTDWPKIDVTWKGTTISRPDILIR